MYNYGTVLAISVFFSIFSLVYTVLNQIKQAKVGRQICLGCLAEPDIFVWPPTNCFVVILLFIYHHQLQLVQQKQYECLSHVKTGQLCGPKMVQACDISEPVWSDPTAYLSHNLLRILNLPVVERCQNTRCIIEQSRSPVHSWSYFMNTYLMYFHIKDAPNPQLKPWLFDLSFVHSHASRIMCDASLSSVNTAERLSRPSTICVNYSIHVGIRYTI